MCRNGPFFAAEVRPRNKSHSGVVMLCCTVAERDGCWLVLLVVHSQNSTLAISPCACVLARLKLHCHRNLLPSVLQIKAFFLPSLAIMSRGWPP